MALEGQQTAPTREQMGMYIEAATQAVQALNTLLDAALTHCQNWTNYLRTA